MGRPAEGTRDLAQPAAEMEEGALSLRLAAGDPVGLGDLSKQHVQVFRFGYGHLRRSFVDCRKELRDQLLGIFKEVPEKVAKNRDPRVGAGKTAPP